MDHENYFIDKLTLDHVDYIADYWTDKYMDMPIIKKYLQNIITMFNDLSVGIFLRSCPSYPVSWIIYGDFGYCVFMYTIPEYRRNGFSRLMFDKLFSSLLENNMYFVGECIKNSFDRKSKNVKILFPGYTWRDSVTGECYW